jgi:putative SOS response-associated peptidase YedK
MPLILNEHEINIWLNGNAADALELAKPYADNEMEAHTISSLVSNPRGDRNNADVQNKYTYPELEQNLLF